MLVVHNIDSVFCTTHVKCVVTVGGIVQILSVIDEVLSISLICDTLNSFVLCNKSLKVIYRYLRTPFGKPFQNVALQVFHPFLKKSESKLIIRGYDSMVKSKQAKGLTAPMKRRELN